MTIPDSTKTDISFIFQNNSETKERALQFLGEYVLPLPPLDASRSSLLWCPLFGKRMILCGKHICSN